MINAELKVMIEKGTAARERGDFENALGCFIQAIEDDPGLISAYIEAGRTEKQAGNKSAALSWFNKAERVNKTNFWPYYLQAEVMSQEGDHIVALNYISQGLSACKGKVSETEYTNLIKCFIDLNAKANSLSNDEMSGLLASSRPPGRALENALRVSLVKDEEDIIYHSLEASYQVGIRYYVIADNKSSDSTKIEIQKFSTQHPECIVFVVDDPVDGYYQASKTMGLAQFGVTVLEACGKNVEWVFPLDADECIHIGQKFEDLHFVINSESSKKHKLLVYYLCNASTKNVLASIEKVKNLDSLFLNFSSYCSQPVRKVAFRYSKNSFLEYGNHYCSNCVADVEEIISGYDFGIFLKHYPMRSLHQLKSKIVNGGKSISAVSLNSIGAHWRQDYEKFLREGDEFIRRRLSDYRAITQDFSIEN